mmetsp:Transcript_17007/g.46120  ORF Transcript_17007/g.46120 Transcript_17007/m.46120 type:complete len:97 (+) Transcript_17007:1866-2156(+)
MEGTDPAANAAAAPCWLCNTAMITGLISLRVTTPSWFLSKIWNNCSPIDGAGCPATDEVLPTTVLPIIVDWNCNQQKNSQSNQTAALGKILKLCCA